MFKQEFEINPVQMIPWEFVPCDLIDEIENKLRIWCDNVEVYFDRDHMELGLNVPIEGDQEEVLSWHEIQDLGLVGALNIVLLNSRHSQISIDWVTGRSPGVLVSQVKPEILPQYIDSTFMKLERFGYEIEELRGWKS